MKKLPFFFLALLLVSMAACSKQNIETQNADIASIEYTQKMLPLPEGMGLIRTHCVNNSQVLIGVMGDKPLFGGMNFDGSGEISVLPDGYEYIYAVCNVGDGVAVLAGDYPSQYRTADGGDIDNLEPGGELSILLYDMNNKLVSETLLSVKYIDKDMNFNLLLYVDDCYLLMSEMYLMGINQKGVEVGRIAKEGGNSFSSMCLYGDSVIISRSDYSSTISQIYNLDIENFILREKLNIDSTIVLGLGIAEDGNLLINDAIIVEAN